MDGMQGQDLACPKKKKEKSNIEHMKFS